MTTTHTPGPWVVDDTEYIDIVAPAGRVAMLDSDALDHRAIAANAALIAAAPDLLAALRGVMTWWADTLPPHGADDDMPAHLFDAAHAAIARATGADA